MKILYDVETLKKLISCITELTGISVALLDSEHNYLVSTAPTDDYCSRLQREENYVSSCAACDGRLLEACKKSQSLESHICHAGLYDFAMPIEKDGLVVAYIIMGRVRSEKTPPRSDYRFDGSDELYGRIPYISSSQISSLICLMPHILFNSAIKICTDGLVDEIKAYLADNLGERTTVDILCRKFHISKNTLYALFKDELGCTVNDYKNGIRIRRAQELLLSTDEPVWAIAEAVGISNYPYFCRLFKRTVGVTALRYRAESEK